MAYDFNPSDYSLSDPDKLRAYLYGGNMYQPASPPTEQQGGNQLATAVQAINGLLGSAPEPTPSENKPQQQERVPVSERISDRVLEAAQLPEGQQGQQIQLTPNSQQGYWASRDYANGLLAMKSLYESAPEGEKGGETRDITHKAAELLREQAAVNGLDLNPYGSGVNAQGVYQQLQAEKTRDIIAAMEGEYSKSSEDFYQDSFYKQIMLGFSPRQAKRIAGNLAREYQAKRVAYLDNLYNHYGRDGYVTNELGVQSLGWLSQENPTLANLYLQAYPNPQNAYARQNQLEDAARNRANAVADKNLDYQHDIGKLVAGGNIDAIIKALTHGYNMEQATHESGLRMNERALDTQLVMRNERYKYGLDILRQEHLAALEKDKLLFMNDIDLANQAAERKFKSEQERQEYERKQQDLYRIGAALGFQGQALTYFYAVNMGYKLPEAAKQDKEFVKNMQAYYNAAQKEKENIVKALTEGNLPDEERQPYQTRLSQLDAIIRNLDSNFATEFNVVAGQELPAYGTNQESNLAGARLIASNARADATTEEITADILAWIRESDKYAPEDELRKWIESDVLRLPEEPKKQPTQQEPPKNLPKPEQQTARKRSLQGQLPYQQQTPTYNGNWRLSK